MFSSVWKGYLSFGLVSVPISLFTATRESHVSFNQIHGECGTRIKQQLCCPSCERVVDRAELAKGYAVDRDQYVTVTAEELKSVESESSNNMSISQFVKLSESKQSGITPAKNEPRKRMGQVVNLMDALKKSLEQEKVASEQRNRPQRVITPAKKASSRSKRAS